MKDIQIYIYYQYIKKIAFGNKGFPWKNFNSKIQYKKGLCPIAETLHSKSFLNFEICKYDLTQKDLNLISKKFIKVWNYLNTQKTKKSV